MEYRYQIRAESGCQLLARLAQRPSLTGLDDHVLVVQPNQQTIVEVSGDPGTGKTLLLLQWAAKALLPQIHGGHGSGVLLIDTDRHASLSTLTRLLNVHIMKHTREEQTSDAVEAIIKNALKQLTVITICDSTQLLASVLSLNKFLLNARHISLILLDSLTAFYWSDLLSSGVCSKEGYQDKIVSMIQRLTKDHHNIVFVFTKPADFASRSGPSHQHKNNVKFQCIYLQQLEDNFMAHITSEGMDRIRPYCITSEGLKWFDLHSSDDVG